MKNHLSVTHNNKILELSWSNIELLKQYYVAQTARKMYSEEEMKDNEKFLIKFNEIANRFFLKTNLQRGLILFVHFKSSV